MASNVDFPINIESKYISRLVDLPLYRSRDERPVISEINCEPPHPEVMHDSERSSENIHIKKSVSCTSLPGYRIRAFYPFEASNHRPYETYHSSNTMMDPLTVQKPKKKKSFLKSWFMKRKPDATTLPEIK